MSQRKVLKDVQARWREGADTAVEEIDLLGDVGRYAAPGDLFIPDCAGGDALEDPGEGNS